MSVRGDCAHPIAPRQHRPLRPASAERGSAQGNASLPQVTICEDVAGASRALLRACAVLDSVHSSARNQTV